MNGTARRRPRSLAFRVVRALLFALAGAYIAVTAVVWYSQASLLFHPGRVIDETPAGLGVKFENVRLPLGDDRIAGWWVPGGDPQARTLLYLHGHAGNLSANADHVVRLHGLGLNVFIVDYRGYGESTGGPPRERLVYEDAARAWAYLVDERRIAPARIVIYGHSLGGAVAIDLASKHPDAGALITECTFTSVMGAARGSRYEYLPLRFILTERFDSISKIRTVRLPKLILHGDADTLLPSRMAQELFEAAPEPKQLAVISGGGHDNSAVVNPAAYFGAVRALLDRLD